MRFTNLRFEDTFINEDSVDFQIEATNELITTVNDIRKALGNTDLVEVDADNEVYYNFYLVCNPNTRYVSITAICHHGELDDYAEYVLPLTGAEAMDLTFQAIKELIKEEN